MSNENEIKIVDCFIFYNELDLLNYRLHLLNDWVDFFVIVESTHTFVGREKPLFFVDQAHRFQKFQDKIIHVVVEDMPYQFPNIQIDKHVNEQGISYQKGDQWQNEFHQRNAIARGISLVSSHLNPHDLLILSDVDEIPNPLVLRNLKENTLSVEAVSLEMDFYYYNLNTKLEYVWRLSKILSYQQYLHFGYSIDKLRNTTWVNVPHGGWHLSYFGDKHFISNKLQNFSHQEFNDEKYTDPDTIQERIQQGVTVINYGPLNIPFTKIDICENKRLPPLYHVYLKSYYTESMKIVESIVG